MSSIWKRAALSATLCGAILACGCRADAAAETVVGVSEGGLHGAVDAAFGQALAAARQRAAVSGAKAFVVDSISGTYAVDRSAQALVVRLALLPDLDDEFLRQQATGGAGNGLDDALRAATPPLADQVRGTEVADWLFRYVVAAPVGRLNEGGVPPQVYAVSLSGELPPLGDGGLRARWVTSQALLAEGVQADLDKALAEAAKAMPAGTQRFAYRIVGWSYNTGGIAGVRDAGVTIEARPLGDEDPLPIAGPAEQAIETVRKLVADHDWVALARHYERDRGAEQVELQSGAYFHRHLPPIAADPAGLWRYRAPFHPAAKLMSIESVAEAAVVMVTMAVDIDQGGGTPQRMLYSFKMREYRDGYLLLAD